MDSNLHSSILVLKSDMERNTLQASEQNEEMIHSMKEVTLKLLKNFYETNKQRKPQRIIFYRDGVSEGQFLQASYITNTEQLSNL